MTALETRKELLKKIHDEILENLLRNEINVIYYKNEDKFVNTADAKRQARDLRDKAIENVGQIKRTIPIILDLLSKEE